MKLGHFVYLNIGSKIIIRDFSHKVICKFHRTSDNWIELLKEKGIFDTKIFCFSISHNKLNVYITRDIKELMEV